MTSREKATKEIIKWVEKILPGGENKRIYEEYLGKLTNAQFDEYMKKLASGEETLFLTAPNFNDKKISVERNLDIAEEIGHDFFERLWLTDPQSGTTYLTPIPYMVIDLPLRRQAQRLNKKINIPENASHTDDVFTGQAAGPSKGTTLSYPELQMLYAQGLDSTIEELIRFRGGDEDGYKQMSNEIIKTGSSNIKNISSKTRVKSTETLNVLLKSIHLDNNL